MTQRTQIILHNSNKLISDLLLHITYDIIRISSTAKTLYIHTRLFLLQKLHTKAFYLQNMKIIFYMYFQRLA